MLGSYHFFNILQQSCTKIYIHRWHCHGFSRKTAEKYEKRTEIQLHRTIATGVAAPRIGRDVRESTASRFFLIWHVSSLESADVLTCERTGGQVRFRLFWDTRSEPRDACDHGAATSPTFIRKREEHRKEGMDCGGVRATSASYV